MEALSASTINFPQAHIYNWDQLVYDFSDTSEDFLGSGGFAEVYRVKAVDPGRLPSWYSKKVVAAKILGPGQRTRMEKRRTVAAPL